MGRRVALVLALREPELVHTIGHYYTVCPASTMFRDGKSCTKVCPRREVFGSLRRPDSRLVDAAVGASQYVPNFHAGAGCFPNALERTVVFNPVRIARRSLAPAPGDRITFVFLGRIEQEKGVETLLDAFSCGLPAIGMRVGGLPEIIDHERTGTITRAGDAPALRGAMLRLMEGLSLLAAYTPRPAASARSVHTTVSNGGDQTMIRGCSSAR